MFQSASANLSLRVRSSFNAREAKLARRHFFFYASRVKTCVPLYCPSFVKSSMRIFSTVVAIFIFCSTSLASHAELPQKPDVNAPAVTQVDPPSWWIQLTPELMLLLSGRHLEATRVTCNLPSIQVERTRATAGGDYLFIWLTIGPDTQSGTAVCRITTPTGKASFELPLAARTMKLGRNQGLSQEDVIYLILPD